MSITRRLGALAIAALAVAGAARTVSAQITTGTITGTVKDAQGAVIPNAWITLTNDAQGTQATPVMTDRAGTYTFPNVAAGTYSVEVTMEGFKTLRRGGIPVSGGDRRAVPDLILEVGGTTETVTVTTEAALVQSRSGERSFTITTTEVENLPVSGAAGRNFASLAQLTPGVFGGTGVQSGQLASRLGGGGQNNIMMDGVSVMDTGNNGQLLNLNPDAIAEVTVLTSGYQAEYGRSSGLQITAVTKSGTNHYRGSMYDISRNSDWNTNTWANTHNGIAKSELKQTDWGYTLGGPLGKPGGTNRLFFFHAMEYRPRTGGDTLSRFRFPTALERQGDFSQTLDNNGALFNLIRDAQSGLPCTAADTRGCFQDGGVLGRIPQNRLYGTGLAILSNLYPVPNLTQQPSTSYNYEVRTPVAKTLSYQPTARLDYQMSSSLRVTGKYNGENQNAGVRPTPNVSLPGVNETLREFPWIHAVATTMNYSMGPTTFLEATYGLSQNRLGTPVTTAISNRFTAGLGGIPQLFPNAGVVDPRYYEYGVLSSGAYPFFENGVIKLPPQFTWGNRIASTPPNIVFPGYLNINKTQDVSISLTKIAGRHTGKMGFYYNHSYKAQNSGASAAGLGAISFANDTLNPLDSGFGFSNAALGTFTSYSQTERFIEGSFLSDNIEFYLQDNWKVKPRLTLDYGVRLTHQQPQYDQFLQSSNFFPAEWRSSAAPMLFTAGCAGASPCTGNNRQAVDPRTGALLGAGSSAVIGQVVPGTGSTTNGIHRAGDGISKYNYTWPMIAAGPRGGFALDLTGTQRVVLRGSGGLFFDRPDGNTVFSQVTNPPTTSSTIVRYAQLQSLGSGGITSSGVATLNAYRYDNSNLPSDLQWNTGLQMALPWTSSLDVAYVGHHSDHVLFAEQNGTPVNLNAIDIGTAFRPSSQDPTQAAGTAVTAELMRPYRGYGNINQQWQDAYRTFHSVQTTFNRRFRNGLSTTMNWTLTLSDKGTQGIQRRLEHNADGSFSVRADQATADALLSNQGVRRHLFKGNFVWDMPDLHSDNAGGRTVGLLINDWQLSGIFTGGSGIPYDIGFTHQTGGGNQALTGSPDYPARIVINGDTGSGCSADQYKQFNTAAFSSPSVGSVGLESGRNYMIGCPDHTLDLALARNIRLGGARQLQMRLEAFNALNTVVFNARQTQVQYNSPTDLTIRNPQFNADGTINDARLLPNNAGFGAVTGAQPMRSMQAQIRFQF
jgi:hypothetical protein